MNARKIKTQTLFYVVLALLIIVGVASAIIFKTTTTLKVNLYQQRSADAYQLAKAGVERAKVELANDWDNWTMDTDGNGMPKRDDPDKETTDLGKGEYWVNITNEGAGPPKWVRVESHGWVGQAHRVIEVELEQQVKSVPGSPTTNFSWRIYCGGAHRFGTCHEMISTEGCSSGCRTESCFWRKMPLRDLGYYYIDKNHKVSFGYLPDDNICRYPYGDTLTNPVGGSGNIPDGRQILGLYAYWGGGTYSYSYTYSDTPKDFKVYVRTPDAGELTHEDYYLTDPISPRDWNDGRVTFITSEGPPGSPVTQVTGAIARPGTWKEN
ncbi:MAG: hypothetical protein WCY34_02755 [Candidatus Omnitrophota bacterium]|jgi:hypothetical protein